MTREEAIAEAQAIANQQGAIMAVWDEVSEFADDDNGRPTFEHHYCPAEQSDRLARDAIPSTMVLVTPQH